MASNFGSFNNQNNDKNDLFLGDSQMATLMRGYDWDTHPLGNPNQWPLSLKTALRIMLHSAHPMFIWWSEELYMFHNDSYVPLIGNKHPAALGAKSNEVWAEIWPQMGAVIEGIMQGDNAFYGEELLVPINRKGFMEETYFTFSYSAMYNDEGRVNGIFCACTEVTETVLAKRRLNVIKDIAAALSGLASLEQAAQAACEVLDGSPEDVPFSLIYLLNEAGTEARLLRQTAGLPREIAPLHINLCKQNGRAKWPFAKVQHTIQPEIVALAEQGLLLEEGNPPVPAQAIIHPIFQQGLAKPESEKSQLLGFFVSGISPRREYDTDYQNFHQLLAGQLANSFSTINSRANVESQKVRLERLFMQAPAAICILDGPNLVYELVNPGYQQLFPDRELLGKPILEAVPEIADNSVYRTIREVYETGKTHEEQALLIPLARPEDGKLEDRYFKYILQARYDAHGQIDGVLAFAYEITELVRSKRQIEESEKRLQATSEELAATNEELAAVNEEVNASNEELSESNQQLLRINSDLDNFIYTASHDLKAPISNIEGLLQALLRSLPAESKALDRIQLITDMMQGSIERFKKTIASLTEITKLQKDNNQQLTLVSIADVVKDVIPDLEPMSVSINARLETAVEDCSPIQFSYKNLRSIVYNLLSNALKYHSPEREPLVQVSCRQEEDFVVLKVQDNGLGMDLLEDTKIFTMFKRLHDHVEGTGIGLYMVKKIIENAGGKIEVESKVGEGSVFQVFFKR